MEYKNVGKPLDTNDIALMIESIELCQELVSPDLIINDANMSEAFASAKQKLEKGKAVFTPAEYSAILSSIEFFKGYIRKHLSQFKKRNCCV